MIDKKFAFAAPVLVLALSSNAFAWGSIGILGASTHTKIADKALHLIDFNLYPDMDTSSRLIKNGSTSEAGHEKIHNGGGKLKDWWTGADGRDTLKGGVLPNYTKLKISDAYLNIGRMCHLTQDQAVPAHSARVPHSVVLNLPPDGMEKFTGKHDDFAEVPQIENNKKPYEYYQILQSETRSHLGEWKNPRTQVPYWNLSDEGARLQDATQGAPGHYGGTGDTYLEDALAGTKLTAAGLTATQLAARQLAMAAGYTKALVESASKLLPPLVSGLAVYPNVATPGHKVEIAFTALENRTRHLKYAVVLTRKGGQPQTVLAGEIGLDKPRVSFNTGSAGDQQAAPAPEESLFNKRVSLKWDAMPAGKPLAEGLYAVEVQLTDDDGNTVPASVNLDDMRENNSVTMLSVVNTEPQDIGSISFN